MKPFSAPYTVLTDRLRGRGEKSKWIEYLITATCAIGYVSRGTRHLAPYEMLTKGWGCLGTCSLGMIKVSVYFVIYCSRLIADGPTRCDGRIFDQYPFSEHIPRYFLQWELDITRLYRQSTLEYEIDNFVLKELMKISRLPFTRLAARLAPWA